MNDCKFNGNLTKDVEIKNSGDTVIGTFTLAVKDGYKKGEADFINFKAFNKTAETIAKYFKKGSGIIISRSRFKPKSWKDDTGKWHNNYEMIVESWEFDGSKSEKGIKNADLEKESAKSEDFVTVEDDDDLPF